METCFLKLEEVREIYKREGCEKLLVGGDWFHLKSWIKNPYQLVNKAIDYFNLYGPSKFAPIMGIYGDHDLNGRDVENLDRQPLGTLVKAVGIKLLNKGDGYMVGGDTWITGCPKVDSYESDVSNYMPAFNEEAKFQVHMVHGDLYPSRPVYDPYTLYSSLKDSPAHITLRGHIHRNDGIVQVGRTKIVGIGSMTRGTFNTDSINRRPGVAIIDTSTLDVKFVELKSAPNVEDIFDFAKKAEIEKAEVEIDKLSQLIKHESTNQELQGPEQVFEEVRKLKVDEKVKSTALRLLEKAQEYVS
jgi:DNA repair exonuclease SbcCD nuclease subunit